MRKNDFLHFLTLWISEITLKASRSGQVSSWASCIPLRPFFCNLYTFQWSLSIWRSFLRNLRIFLPVWRALLPIRRTFPPSLRIFPLVWWTFDFFQFCGNKFCRKKNSWTVFSTIFFPQKRKKSEKWATSDVPNRLGKRLKPVPSKNIENWPRNRNFRARGHEKIVGRRFWGFP